MTNVTSKKVGSKEFIKAEQVLTKLLCSSEKQAGSFLSDFLSDSERIMLIKRFAAVWMYTHNYSQYVVWNTLYISPTTATRIYHDWQGGQYQTFIKQVSPKDKSAILSFIHDFITAQVDTKARARLVNRALKN